MRRIPVRGERPPGQPERRATRSEPGVEGRLGSSPRAFVVAGLGFGDEGKGTVTDFLVRATGAKAVVRYNGGPQAGHNVVTPDGRWHCFAQLGAGSFVDGVRTVLAPQMLVELENLAVEAGVLASKGVPEPLASVTIDPRCTLVTPMHKMLGQLAEVARGRAKVGTCGMGVGEAVRGAEAGLGVTVGDVAAGRLDRLERLAEVAAERAEELVAARPAEPMRDLLRYFRDRCRPRALLRRYQEILDRCRVRKIERALSAGPLVFEGAQGALLDRRHGFAPYVTQSRATVHNALDLLRGEKAITIGVMRAYGHRHGPGPFPTEDGRLGRRLADPYNRENRWQGRFRLGRLDLVALRYGLKLNGGVDCLAVTGLDRLTGLARLRLCTSYSFEGDLRLLDGWTEWERRGRNRARILEILGRPEGLPSHATGVLMRCRPLEWTELSGWSAGRGAGLPPGALRLVDALEDALGTPVGLVSVSPDALGKRVISPFQIVGEGVGEGAGEGAGG